MATGYVKCAGCGEEIKIKCMGKSSKDTERYCRWLESQGHLCADCEEKERAAENAAAAEANKAAGLLDLAGSEKQIAWAETIRQNLIQEIESDPMNGSDGYDVFVRLVKEKTQASWWIDHRDMTVKSLVREMADEIKAAMVEEAEGAQEEALLKPQGELESSLVAEIRLLSGELRVSLAEKNDKFRQVVKSIGFRWDWDHSCWYRPLGFQAGNPVDRAAETAHRLLEAGFIVRLYDEEARAKAISGEFEPEQRRWVVKSVGGKYDGWFRISWPREDDLYNAAQALPGSKYYSGDVYVPADAALEVADFAERYDFALSEGAKGLIEGHQAALSQGVVVDKIKKPKPSVSDDGIPKLSPEQSEVDDDLLDND
ncbi:hypothetical protein [Microbulbifer thermotolerans]|uniref:hypothetical protein n=1 Tax=Microbulbifer thermotolerans TaxID=252514 RepID=UPI00224B7142|nr:hypothetical protein [Microbulbifer thermotolerans]MCX2780435.1 hypothetical protein [Microbulbifer thermotolerans]MCX2805893.1 hypothetical protein [Microbulbifer thermotolerans]